MNKIIYPVALVLLIMVFSACKNQQKAKRKDLKVNKTEYLLQQLENNTFDFEYFSAKASVRVESEDKKTPFKANIRIRKDSAIWISITPALGIEVARILITADSVKVINRIEKNYFVGNYAYVNKRFNIDMEFNLIQSILVGNHIAFEEDDKIKFSIDKEKYYLGNLRKRKAKKADEKPQKIEKQKEEVVSLWIDQSSFKIVNFIFSDLTANRFITGSYSAFEMLDKQLIPTQMSFDFQSEKPANVELEYSKLSLEGPLKFSFNISSKYEQVYY